MSMGWDRREHDKGPHVLAADLAQRLEQDHGPHEVVLVVHQRLLDALPHRLEPGKVYHSIEPTIRVKMCK